MQKTLIIMAKAPVVGQVKTRLAASIGRVAAARFYRAMSAAIIARLGADPRWRTILAVSPDRFCDAANWPKGLQRVGQGRGNLGVRMQRLLDLEVGEVGTSGSTLVIGTDIPSVAPHHIAKAFRVLGQNDVVFGPAEDGGYWLVGTRGVSAPSQLFADVRWSTGHTLADTQKNAVRYSTGLCDTLNDVDDHADYLTWRSRAPRRIRSNPECD